MVLQDTLKKTDKKLEIEQERSANLQLTISEYMRLEKVAKEAKIQRKEAAKAAKAAKAASKDLEQGA